MPDNIIKILNVKINALAKAEILERIKNLLLSESFEQCQLVTTNPEFIISAQKDEEFKNIINNSWLSVADGYGIRLAAKYNSEIQKLRNLEIKGNNPIIMSSSRKRGSRGILCGLFFGLKIAWWGILKKDEKLDIIKETITGTDLIPEIAGIMNYELGIMNKKVFFLGGYGDVPRLAAEKLQSIYSVGAIHGLSPQDRVYISNNTPLQIKYAPFEVNNIIEKINLFQPAVLFVALNHPRAQKWINENLQKMPSVKLAIGVGGAFDYISGKIKRAPKNWQGSFEWLYRLFYQPKRWKRIWQASIVFPWGVFRRVIYKN